MTNYIFILILLTLAIIDYLYYKIPNVIILPAIALGIYLTGNWFPALIMFCVSALIYKEHWWRGGDVKLMCLIGAFLGSKAIFILPLTLCLIYLYRIIKKYTASLAVTPFSLVVSLPFLFL